MEFRVEEYGVLLNLYPLHTDSWMVVRAHGVAPWKLYKKIDDVHSYIDEFSTLNLACDAAKGL